MLAFYIKIMRVLENFVVVVGLCAAASEVEQEYERVVQQKVEKSG